MCVSSHLLKLCDEFFEEISPEEMSGNTEVTQEIQKICDYLEDRSEHGGDEDDAEVIEETQFMLRGTWSLMSREERRKNINLSTHYNELQEHLEYLFEECRPVDSDSSWRDEYLVENEGDDFYCDTDDFLEPLDGEEGAC